MKKLLLAFAFATTLSVTATIGQAQQIPDPRVADLVQAGKIRVGLFLPQFSKDAVTGELKGVRVEIARALAARIGVQIVLLEHPAPGRGLPQGQRMRLFVSVARRSARRRRRLFAPNFPI